MGAYSGIDLRALAGGTGESMLEAGIRGAVNALPGAMNIYQQGIQNQQNQQKLQLQSQQSERQFKLQQDQLALRDASEKNATRIAEERLKIAQRQADLQDKEFQRKADMMMGSVKGRDQADALVNTTSDNLQLLQSIANESDPMKQQNMFDTWIHGTHQIGQRVGATALPPPQDMNIQHLPDILRYAKTALDAANFRAAQVRDPKLTRSAWNSKKAVEARNVAESKAKISNINASTKYKNAQINGVGKNKAVNAVNIKLTQAKIDNLKAQTTNLKAPKDKISPVEKALRKTDEGTQVAQEKVNASLETIQADMAERYPDSFASHYKEAVSSWKENPKNEQLFNDSRRPLLSDKYKVKESDSDSELKQMNAIPKETLQTKGINPGDIITKNGVRYKLGNNYKWTAVK